MKSIKYNPVIFKMLLASAVLLACTSGKGYCQYEQEQGYSLLVQASPVDTGFITPEPGVHRFGLNEIVVLKAVPRPGYRFLYWLGDVDNPTANETITNLDSPKLVIAVFEREEFSLLTPSTMPQKGRGSGGAIASANTFTPRNSMSSPGPRWPKPPPFIWPDQDDFPVPGNPFPVPVDGDDELDEEDEFPVPDEPIPEPATIALLGFGAVTVLRRKRRG